MEFCSENPISGQRIQTEIGDELIWVKADFVPCGAPLALSPIIVGQGDAESGVSDPVHKAQARTGCQAVAIVILDEHAVRRHAAGLAQKSRGMGSVVQNVGEENRIERLIVEGDARSVEHFNRDVGAAAGQHVDAAESEIGAAGLENGGDKTIAAADVKHAG